VNLSEINIVYDLVSGRTEPVPFYVKSDLTGLGKVNQDFEMIETTVSQRRGMDSERQQRESEEQRKLREVTLVSIPSFIVKRNI